MASTKNWLTAGTVSQFRTSDFLAAILMFVAAAIAGCGPSVKVPTAAVSGTVTVNGKPVEGVDVWFLPDAPIRPGVGLTDSQGSYSAKFLEHQMGVPLGPCTVTISLYRDGQRVTNLIPPKYNENAAENPELRITIPKEGMTFNYDVKTDKPLP